MKVHTISSPSDLENGGTFFEISHLLWGTPSIPYTSGRIGYVEGEGFFVSMRCEEADPLRVHTTIGSPVYQDSAMEAFFLFSPEKGSDKDIPQSYINIEFNANGAFLAMYGPSRSNRILFSEEDGREIHLCTTLGDGFWEASFSLPLSLLARIYGTDRIAESRSFSLNFYKISETSAIEHYAAYAPILTATPDFHHPEYFENSSF